jgi:DNA polymerase III sliding clamp (beta) subunit (PCNA family)
MSTATVEALATLPTVSITPFVRALKSVRPFACTESTLPTLAGIHVKAEGETLALTATDRYTAGIYRLHYAGPAFATFLPSRSIKALIDVLAPYTKSRAKYDITLTLGNSTLTVLQWGSPILTVETQDSQGFPKIESLIPEIGEPSEALSFNPAYLARFAKVETTSSESMRLTFNGAKATRVDIGRDFTGLIMPIRERDSRPEIER